MKTKKSTEQDRERPTLAETRGGELITVTLGELLDMQFIPPGLGQHWLWRAPDKNLWWVLPDCERGPVMVPALKSVEEAMPDAKRTPKHRHTRS